MKKPRILVCNDDGINGPGLPALIAAMRRLGHVTVSVPEHERSADSHSLTLHKPIRVRRVSPDTYTLNGSPADCARFAVLEILKERVDLVVSGINRGYNLGEDVIYSGTVAAAMEATLLRIPSLAFSLDPDGADYRPAAAFAQRLARQTLHRGLPLGVCLNVNFPVAPKGGYKTAVPAKLGRRIYGTDITRRADPRGLEYFWLAGRQVTGVDEPGTDVAAVSRGKVSVTPLKIDNTDAAALQGLSAWKF
ncbi:MAG TPA: 5'/3'-nucleotidase SurE [Elusimicrobiota bacterium]|nr:5'/3'-nucleotidase SurE [Elusimicrobiota bacterium]